MRRRINVGDHVSPQWLVNQTGVTRREATCFHRAFLHVVETALRDDQLVILPGLACGPSALQNTITALDAELPADAPSLWVRPGHEIAGLLGLTGWDATSITTLADLVPAIDRKLHALGCPISDRGFFGLIRAATDEIEAEWEHLTFNLSPVERESSIEDWVMDNLGHVGSLMDMPSLEIYQNGAGRSGRQWRFANGRRADLVCRTTEDSDRIPGGTWLVIELKAGYGVTVDVDQISEYVELIEEELADPDEGVLGCLLADGFDPDTASRIRETDAPVFLQTLTAIGFHDARFADAVVVGLSSRGSNDANWTQIGATAPGPRA